MPSEFVNLDEISTSIDEELISEDEEWELIPERQRKTLYLYELKKLFKQKENALVTFSPNSVNLLIIEKEEYVEIKGWIPEADSFEYLTKQSISNVDNEIDIVQKSEQTFYSYIDIQGSVNFSNSKAFIYQKNRLYFVSPIKIENDEEILNFGSYIQALNYEEGLTATRNGKKVFKLVDLETWTTRDGNQTIIRIGTPLPNDTEIKEIEIDTPSSFLLESFKVLGTDGFYKKVELNTPMINLWLNPIEKLASGELNFLNLWMSERVLKFENIKDYLNDDSGADLSKLLILSEDDDPDPKEEKISLKNVAKLEIQIKDVKFYEILMERWETDAFKGLQKVILEPNVANSDTPNFLPYKDPDIESPTYGKWLKRTTFVYTNGRQSDGWIPQYAKDLQFAEFGDIIVTTREEQKISSLYKLLIEILNASYNYNNNFKGAGYIDDDQQKGLNKMALYKQEFEGKTIIEYIDGLEKNWEKKHPKLVETQAYKNYQMIRNMLSGFIYGTNSISGGLNEDYKVLLPYYFKLLTKPTWGGETGSKEDDGTAIWEYSTTLLVTIDSLYFNFSGSGNITLKNTTISTKKIMNLTTNNSWIWNSISSSIDETEIPSLNSGDFKLSDENIGKFLVYAPKVFEKLLGSNNENLKVDMGKIIELNSNLRNLIKLNINDLKNLKQLNISGIYGSGNWNINFVLKNKTKVILKNLTLFKVNKQSIANINIQF